MINKTDKLRVAVVGCGRISVRHFGAIEEVDEVTLVACCDIDRARADVAAAENGCRAYYDYKEMLECEQLDAIHICLPHYLHSEVACAAIEKGVAVLTEKPMDISYEAAEKAVRFAKERGVLFGVIFQCRYNPSSVLVKRALDSGRLGKIISARSTLTWKRDDDYYFGSDWKGTWEKEGGGVVIDQAIHSIDLVNWMMGCKHTAVSASLSRRRKKIVSVEDTADGLVEYENGATYAFYCMNNYGCDEPIEIRLYCERGQVVFTYTDAVIRYDDGTVEEAKEEMHDECGGKAYWGYQHTRQVRQFYDACLGKEPLEISGEEALKTHALICEIYEVGKRTLG